MKRAIAIASLLCAACLCSAWTARTTIPAALVATQSGTQWTPADLTGLALWLDASDASTLWADTNATTAATNNGLVARWDDKSGNARHVTQPTGGTQPTLQTNTIYFSGSKALIGSTMTTYGMNAMTQSRSMVVVYTSGTTDVAMCSNYNTAAPSFGGHNSGLATHTVINVRAGSARTSTAAFTPAAGTFIGIHGYNGSNKNIYAWRNGVESTSYVNQNVTDTGGFDSGIAYRFGQWGNLASHFTGSIREVVFAAQLLSVSDRQKLEGYLAHKWDLEANLPADHSYKSAAPTK
jgi:hypothetical protein